MNVNVPLAGRPHGSCAILWINLISYKVEKLSCISTRLCTDLKFLNAFTELFNVYICHVM